MPETETLSPEIPTAETPGPELPPDCPGCGLPEHITLPPYCARCNLEFFTRENLGPKHYLDMNADRPYRAFCGRESSKLRFTNHNSSVECEACLIKGGELNQALAAAYAQVLGRPNRYEKVFH